MDSYCIHKYWAMSHSTSGQGSKDGPSQFGSQKSQGLALGHGAGVFSFCDLWGCNICLVLWNMFFSHSVGNVIIPTGRTYIFSEGLKPPTSIYIYIYVCMYIYLYMYTYIYVCIYIYIPQKKRSNRYTIKHTVWIWGYTWMYHPRV